jgi:1-acyl-sn-glycerol-3-phosphate acyltransferase
VSPNQNPPLAARPNFEIIVAMLRGISLGLVSLLCILLLGTPLTLYALVSGNTDPLYRAGVYCAAMVMRLGGIRVQVCGREKIPAGRAVVYMANHQSNADAPALFPCLPPVLVLAKKAVFKIPIFGRGMRLRGFIPVDRSDRERAKQAVDAAARSLQAGNSFVIFPEGTRSPDGRLQPFKKGGFVMALKAGAPIVPVSISGGRKIMRKGDWAIHAGIMQVRFHDPIPTVGRSLDDGIIDEVKAAIADGLTEDERPAGQPAGCH